jgi:hypothetical protein
MLNFYSASNGQVNSKKAIQQCLTAALGEAPPSTFQDKMLIVVHCTIGHDFEEIIAGAREICPQAELVGCTCAGVIGKEGANESMRALGMMAVVPGGAQQYHVTSCDNIRGHNSYEEARKMALELKATQADINMIQFLASGIDIAADRAIEGIESVFGADMPIFGGTSSDNMRAISSYQLADGKVLERGAIMIGYSDPTLTIEMGVHHGSVPIGQPFSVTRSEGNRVIEIEGEAAWPYLMSKLDLPADTHPGPCIPVAGMAELLPDGFREPYDNDHILRVIVKVDEDGSFYMPVDCPQGTRLWIVERDEELIFTGLDRMMERLTAQIGDREVAAVFHTDCAARGRAMFDAIVKDEIIENMQQPLTKGTPLPWLGMYGFGEFTRLKGKNLFHNYTTSIYALIRQ